MSIVRDKIMYAAAIREMSPNSGRGIDAYVRQQEQELIRKFGNGSKTAAIKAFSEKNTHSFEKEIQDIRHNIVVQQYITKHVRSKIHVSKKDIRIFYTRNKKKEFSKNETITINLIRSVKPEDIIEIDKQLTAGVKYIDIAKSDLNTYVKSKGGLFEGFPTKLPNVLKELKSINYKTNTYTQPVMDQSATWWAYVKEYNTTPEKSLDQAQLLINRYLRQNQYSINLSTKLGLSFI